MTYTTFQWIIILSIRTPIFWVFVCFCKDSPYISPINQGQVTVRPLSLSSLSAQLWPLAPSRCRPGGAASGPSGPGGATTGRGCSARTAMASRRRLEAATATANRWCQMLGAFRMPQCATRESPYWIHNAIAHDSMI